MSSWAEICFRVDASAQMGTGHAMRCLTLANELNGRGLRSAFLCRTLPDILSQRIRAAGHDLYRLTTKGIGNAALDELAHADWLEVDWQTDAEDCRDLVVRIAPHWLVVDHYALDARWEAAVCPPGVSVMAIDDLADRPHVARLLLDQNLGRQAADYDALLPPNCQRLIGPDYALLRPEFADLRAQSLARRGEGPIGHMMISMGGMNKDDATGQILDVMAGVHLPLELRLSVVMGQQAPALDAVRARIADLPFQAELLLDVDTMGALMCETDLAIGAGGSTCWERGCLGLPSLLLTIADNQLPLARALDAAGAAIHVGDIRYPGWTDALADWLRDIFATGRLDRTFRNSTNICDGLGAGRVGDLIGAEIVTVRRATFKDAEAIWTWRNAGGASAYYKDTTVPSLEDHCAWIKTALSMPEQILLIACKGQTPVAHIRLDRATMTSVGAEISIYVSPGYRGQRIGLRSLIRALQYARDAGITRFDALVHSENIGSQGLFEAAGFARTKSEGNFLGYRYETAATTTQREVCT